MLVTQLKKDLQYAMLLFEKISSSVDVPQHIRDETSLYMSSVSKGALPREGVGIPESCASSPSGDFGSSLDHFEDSLEKQLLDGQSEDSEKESGGSDRSLNHFAMELKIQLLQALSEDGTTEASDGSNSGSESEGGSNDSEGSARGTSTTVTGDLDISI